MSFYLPRREESITDFEIYSSLFALLFFSIILRFRSNEQNHCSEDEEFNSSLLFIGIDCEMVGGPGQESMLARCSLVTLDDSEYENKADPILKGEIESSKSIKSIDGIKVLYDAFVRPTKPVVDYRTKWSGITKERLKQNDVITLQECRRKVLEFLSSSTSDKDKIVVLVGHAIKNDLDVLNIQHPYNQIRDTAYYRPHMREGKRRYFYSSSHPGQRKSTKYYPRKLSDLSKELLGINIQNKSNEGLHLGHDSIEDAASSLLLYKKASLEWEESLDFPLKKIWKEKHRLSHNNELESDCMKGHKDYSSAVLFVGMDCEMVGVRQHGRESMLARCSIVTLLEDDEDSSVDNGECESSQTNAAKMSTFRTMKVKNGKTHKKYKVKVLYDAYVRPTETITDYRTQYSGITKERLEQDDVVSFQECRRNVLELLSSSVDGRVVVLVGHALKNDYEVLNMHHPHELTRDTATYRPYMRQVRKRHYPRKLAELTREQLGLHIQTNGISKSMYNKNGELSEHHQLGHDSVEDAAASLLLYKKASLQWEKSINFPLWKIWKERRYVSTMKDKRGKNESPESFVTLYIDGCNLPLGLRQRKDCDDHKFKYQLLAKNNTDGKVVKTPTDWIPLLRSITSYSSSLSMNNGEKLPIGKVCIFFDGKMFKDPRSKISRPHKLNDLDENVYLEISDDAVEVDDVLVERCIADRNRDALSKPSKNNRNMKSIEEIIEDLKNGLVENKIDCMNTNNAYYVVKRKAGGSKTNKKLFDKLCLRRAEEGAFCLVPSLVDGSPRLQKNSLGVAKQLQHAKVFRIVEYERRSCKDIRSIVVTDDVLLSDRIVCEGGMVLRYNQFKQLI